VLDTSAISLLGKRTLIIGEVRSGKTVLTARIVLNFVSMGLGSEITIIEMAPEKVSDVGGKLTDYLCSKCLENVRYLSAEIIPPRLTSRNEEEALKYAIRNFKILKPLLEKYLSNPTRILVINDLSIYSHAGPFEDIDACIMEAETFLANSYFGKKINGKFPKIGLRERRFIIDLLKFMDNVIVMKKLGKGVRELLELKA